MESLATIAAEVLPAEPALFDYSGFNEGQRQTLRIRASEINTLAKRAVQDVIEIGRKFAEVKDILGGNGKFTAWLSSELGWSERTAYNFIGVYTAFGSADFAVENIAVSALTLLAAPSTPPAAVEAAARLADTGERVTHAIAKEIVRQAKKARPAQVDLIEEAIEAPAESAQNIPENTPEGSSAYGVGTPFPTKYEQSELENMATFGCPDKISEGAPVKICYVREQPHIIVGVVWGFGGVIEVDAMPALPIENVGEENAITYSEALDRYYAGDKTDPNRSLSYEGVKVNCGSKAKPRWWVMVGPQQRFTRMDQEEPTVKAAPCFYCQHSAAVHSEGGCGECLCTGYKPDHRTEDEYWAAARAEWEAEKPAAAESISDVDLKAAARREALFDEATIEITLTVTPRAKKGAAGRLMVGSIAASGREPMFFDGRGDQASIPSLIGEALSRFIEGIDSRPASRPAASKQEDVSDAGSRKRKSR